MAKHSKFTPISCLLLLLTICATSARILDEVTPPVIPLPATTDPIPPSETVVPPSTTLQTGQISATSTSPTTNAAPEISPIDQPEALPIAPTSDAAPVISPTEEPEAPIVEPIADDAPSTTLPSGQIPAASTSPTANAAPEISPTDQLEALPIAPTSDAAPVISPKEEPEAPIVAPIPDVAPEPATPVVAPAADIPKSTAAGADVAPIPDVAPEPATPVVAPATDIPKNTAAGATTATSAGTFSFFMHDILGGSHPSGRAVAGIVANSDANNLPFSKPSNPIFPIDGGVPLTAVNGVINNNNYPFLVGLNGNAPNTLIQSNGNAAVSGGGGNQAFVTAGQLPQGLTVQQLTFGSVTVVDNELTEGHELGSGVVGRAQGIYVTSSTDGSSHTLVLTAALHGGGGHEHELVDTLSFIGVHRTATPVSHIAIVGGTGKYENAKGYAAIEALPHQDQHTTDGIETVTHFTVYITP